MSTNHFVVSERDNVWQFSFRGAVTAPFGARSTAIAAAIAEAREIHADGVEVVVRDADMRSQTIWRVGQGEVSGDLSNDEAAHLAADIERDSDA